jgi:hypothetical protein
VTRCARALHARHCGARSRVTTPRLLLNCAPLCRCRDAQWTPGSLRPYGPLQLSPAAGVLNYGQGIFEGMKAYRTVTGRIVLFRPDQVRARGCACHAVRASTRRLSASCVVLPAERRAQR